MNSPKLKCFLHKVSVVDKLVIPTRIKTGFWLKGAAMVLRQSADHLVVKATLPVSRFNQLVKTALDETEFDTLGGAVTDQLGHVPQRGETVEFEGHEVEVLSADARQARLLRVARLPAG